MRPKISRTLRVAQKLVDPVTSVVTTHRQTNIFVCVEAQSLINSDRRNEKEMEGSNEGKARKVVTIKLGCENQLLSGLPEVDSVPDFLLARGNWGYVEEKTSVVEVKVESSE